MTRRPATPLNVDNTRFENLMRSYSAKAEAVGSGFDMNPSAGNIKDGLVTDAIKSAGAAIKGCTAPRCRESSAERLGIFL